MELDTTPLSERETVGNVLVLALTVGMGTVALSVKTSVGSLMLMDEGVILSVNRSVVTLSLMGIELILVSTVAGVDSSTAEVERTTVD